MAMLEKEASEALLQPNNDESKSRTVKLKATSFSIITTKPNSNFDLDENPPTRKITTDQSIPSVFGLNDSGTGSVPQSPFPESKNKSWPMDEPHTSQLATVILPLAEKRIKKNSESSSEWIEQDDTVSENLPKDKKTIENKKGLVKNKSLLLKLPCKIERLFA